MIFQVASNATRKGFTLIEMVVVIAILVIVVVIAGASFGGIVERQELKRGAGLVRSTLEEARVRTLSSEGASQYGVHVATSTLTLFPGTTYTEGAPDNEIATLPARTHIASTTLVGGDVVVFKRLSGATDNVGTITVSLIADENESRTITIQQTGLIELEQ